MAVQARRDQDTRPFVLFTFPAIRENLATIAQDAGRSSDLEPYTLMAKIAASGKWVPFTNAQADDGSAFPAGIYMGDTIDSADIVAGDVTDVPILEFGVQVDEDQIVLENGTALDDVITASDDSYTQYMQVTVRDVLLWRTIIPTATSAISAAENS